MHFSTRDLPASERIPYWREVFGRQIVRVDIEPQSDFPFEADTTLRALPGVKMLWNTVSTSAREMRTREMIADGDDSIALVTNASKSPSLVSQCGRDVVLRSGDAVVISHAEPAAMIHSSQVNYAGVVVSRDALSPRVEDIGAAAGRLIPRTTGALHLLKGYLDALRSGPDIEDPDLCNLAATQIHDLIALTIGATRDAREQALARSVRAMRLQAIKDDFAANPGLSLHLLAARQGVTPRYVQMLFEAAGTTFTSFAVDQRLTSAHRMLTSPFHRHWTIGAIALEAGFGDLSHFNRSFKRRYGRSPSEVRLEA